MNDLPPLPQRQWALAPPVPDAVVDALAMPRLWAQALYNRGIETRAMAWDLLHVSGDALHDPFLLDQMDAAVSRVLRAVEHREVIAVFGDFDTDGVTASAVLYDHLRRLGADVFVHLPHRVRDGHGLNADAVRDMAERGAGLIITVDCGITSADEVALAASMGIDVVLTDHHAPIGPMPMAHAIVTPTNAYPFPFLTGAGLALKLVQGMCQLTETPTPPEAMELAALGTVADMAPLLGENRAIATLGVEQLRNTQRPGLQALLQAAGTRPESISHETIPFIVAPRLNAAGRMDSAELAFDLLTAERAEDAETLAQRLETLNNERRALTATLLAEGMRQAALQAEELPLLFLAGEEFLPGVGGLVAGALCERFSRPAVVVSLDGDSARASGRSVPGFHLARAIASCADLCTHYGGHPAAAGFAAPLANLDAIRERLVDAAREQLGDTPPPPTLRIDAEAAFNVIPGKTMGFLERLAPFGQENPPPTFLARGVEAVAVQPMGAQGQHLRLTLRQGGANWRAVAFGQRWPEGVELPCALDVVYTPEVDEYRGERRLRFRLTAFRLATHD